MNYFLFRVNWDIQSKEEIGSRIFIQAHTAEEAEQILLNKLKIVQYCFLSQTTLHRVVQLGHTVITYE